MFGALIRAAERWRSVKVTEFERRQMASVRKELDQEYEAMVDQRWSDGSGSWLSAVDNFRKCQTATATPAEPGDLLNGLGVVV